LSLKLDSLSILSINADERNWLERDFEENVLWEVVRDLNGDKAPGLDGFSMAFFQECWEVVKEDILVVFKEFHSQRTFEKSFNAMFLSLTYSRKREVLGHLRIFGLLV